jgi:predicted RNA-binding protein with TRAM domain
MRRAAFLLKERTYYNVAIVMKKNEIYKVKIEAWSSEGDGICRIGGMAVFVKGAVRGDLCDVRILKVLKSNAFAKIENIIEPSPRTGLKATVRCLANAADASFGTSAMKKSSG